MACGNTGSGPVERPPVPPLGLGIFHEDGIFLPFGGLFVPGANGFQVGDGSEAEPDSFVFRINIYNASAFAISDVRVTDEIAPHSGIAVCREIPAMTPFGTANPNRGTIVGGNCSPDGFVWEIGPLLPGQQALLFFRAEAIDEGGDVNRVRVSAESVADFLLHEQPFLISEDGSTAEIDVTVEDAGFGFENSNEVFIVGDDLDYTIVVYNFGPSVATDLRVMVAVGPEGQGIACREIPNSNPDIGGPNPSDGMVDGDTCSPSGFTWRIATLEGNIGGLTAAVLHFRAEALEEGTRITRVVLSGGGLSFPVVIEEPTAIFAD